MKSVPNLDTTPAPARVIPYVRVIISDFELLNLRSEKKANAHVIRCLLKADIPIETTLNPDGTCSLRGVSRGKMQYINDRISRRLIFIWRPDVKDCAE